ncbi:MAG: nuclear transport factor 2 family protein [Terriglobales bacterium]
MSKRLTILFVLFATATACNMWSKPPKGWSGATGGEQIETLFWKDVQTKDWKEVDRHLAATFTATGSGGTADRAAFLQRLQQSPVADVSLTGCNVETNGADMVVACTLNARWGGNPASVSSTLSVWQQLKKGWVMVAHADTPLAPGQVTEK